MRAQRDAIHVLQPDLRKPGRVQDSVIRRDMGLAPQPIDACDVRQVGKLRRRLEVRQEVGERLPVRQQSRRARQRTPRMDRRGGAEPFVADEARDRGKVRLQRVDAALQHRIAVDREAGLRDEVGQLRRHRAILGKQRLREGILVVGEQHHAASASVPCSTSWARPRSASSSENDGTCSSRSISVGRAPMRAISRS